jgi:predicted HAD superfamily phosphohydrolase YqeG
MQQTAPRCQDLETKRALLSGKHRQNMVAASDWITTTRQALPQFFELVSKLRPTHHLPDVRAIDEGFLAHHRVKALIWDVDGTLMAHHHMSVAEEYQSTLGRIAERSDVRQVILSNCGETRFGELGRIFPEIPVLKAYRQTDGTTVLRTLLRGAERWSDGRPGTDLSPLEKGLRPLKKPSAELIEFALAEAGSPPREQVYMVGDQFFTDIAGANLAGIRSIKVPTRDRGSFPFAVRSFQRIEAAIYRILYRAT